MGAHDQPSGGGGGHAMARPHGRRPFPPGNHPDDRPTSEWHLQPKGDTCGRAIRGVSRPKADRPGSEKGAVTIVPIGYLLPLTLVALSTWFALVPLRRPWALGGFSFYFGPFVNELPFLAFYWLLIQTLLNINEIDLDRPSGKVAVGVATLVAVGLGVVVRRGLQAGPAIERALAEGLGSGWRTDLAAEPSTQVRHSLPLTRIVFGSLFVRRHDVERVANISYGRAGRENLLDIYRHHSHPSGGPVMIHLHGGRFTSGRKNHQARPLLYRMASQGWVCISANYRLSPAAQWPDHLVDVKRIIAWVRDHGAEYGADPTRVFVAGSSAGAHLAAMAALTSGDPTFQPDFEDANTSVTAAICLGGYFGDVASGLSSSPLAHVRSDAPPFFVAHGDRDTMTPLEGARLLVDSLRAASSNPVVYAVLPGGQHTFDLFHSLRFETVVNGIEAFTSWVLLKDELRGQARPALVS